jgi:hypothetical protein
MPLLRCGVADVPDPDAAAGEGALTVADRCESVSKGDTEREDGEGVIPATRDA